LGTAVHEYVELSDEEVTSELPLEAYGIVGTSDIVYGDGRLVDIKSTRWITPSKLPYSSHELQVNIYAQMLRKMGHEINRLQIQYIDMSGPTKCRKCRRAVKATWDGLLRCPVCYQIPTDPHLGAILLDVAVYPPEEVEKLILERKAELETALLTGLEPEREESFLCNFCPHSGECLGRR
jgi:hypothetical protein